MQLHQGGGLVRRTGFVPKPPGDANRSQGVVVLPHILLAGAALGFVVLAFLDDERQRMNGV
eukprot:1160775-Pyramimonas_sp.AAC.1